MSAFRETEENFGVDAFLETPVKDGLVQRHHRIIHEELKI